MINAAIFTPLNIKVSKKLFHLHIKQSNTHKYYGSLQAIYDDNNKDIIGISKFTLDRYEWQEPYENENVIIRKGEFLTTGDIEKKK